MHVLGRSRRFHRLKKREDTFDIRRNELPRTYMDRTVDMRLCSKIDDICRFVFREYLADACAIGDVPLYEGIARILSDVREILEIPGLR